MRNPVLFALAFGAAAISAPAIAAPVAYSATSAVSDTLYGGSNDHALWMPMFEQLAGTALSGNSNGSDFNFTPAGTFTIGEDGRAILSGQISSQVDPAFSFDILLSFVGLSGPGSGGPKKELKNSAYSSNGGPIDVATWSYFQLAEGAITGTGSAAGFSFSVLERPSGAVYPGQLGLGANGKNGNLGFSAWFYTVVNGDCSHNLCGALARKGPQAGDINIDLAEVPLPAGFLLFATGLAAVGLRRRRA
ncbi:MAG: VPLPA-CTERM sorting domain-containing protein [Parvularculaceae bacterium]